MKSLTARVLAPIALLVVGALALQAAFSIVEESRLAEQLVRQQSSTLAQGLAQAGTRALLSRDVEELERLTLGQAANKTVPALQFLDAQGRLLVDVDVGAEGPVVRYGGQAPPLPDARTAGPQAGSRGWFALLTEDPGEPELWQAVEGNDGSTLGWVRLQIDNSSARALKAVLWQRSLAIALLALVLAGAGISLVTRAPLMALARATEFARSLASDRGGTVQGYPQVTEIDILLRALNDASAELAAKDAAIRGNALFLEKLTEAVGEGIYATDADGRCVFVNSAALVLTGRSRSAVLGADACAVFHARDGSGGCPSICDPLRGVPAGSSFRSEEVELHRADGTRFPARIVASPFDGQGAPAGMVVAFDDISQRKAVEHELTAAKEAAEEASQVRSRLLAMVSHELLTPMNAVLGMTQLGLRKTTDPSVQRYLAHIDTAGKSLLGLIENLLHYTAAEGGARREPAEPFDLEQVLESVMTRLRPRAIEKGLGFSCSTDDGLPDRLLGYPKAIERVLSLYADNALKFTQSGRIDIKVQTLQKAGSELRMRFSVEDTGIGIDEAGKSLLFRPLQQVDMSLTRRYGGLGMGLALARQLVEQMGGVVGFESREGEGSRFWFDLVLASETVAA